MRMFPLITQLYIRNYVSIMEGFITDDQEDDASITNLTVQLFTVKSISHKLLEEEDAFFIIANFYRAEMEKRVSREGDDAAVKLEEWVLQDEKEYMKMENVISGA